MYVIAALSAISFSSLAQSDDNETAIQQQGNNNVANIEQSSLGADNETSIQQTGNSNTASVAQGYGGFAQGNLMNIEQQGIQNKAYIFQGTGEPLGASADNQIQQSNILLNQQGKDHLAVIIQAGTNQLVDVQQCGTNNTVNIAQGTSPFTP